VVIGVETNALLDRDTQPPTLAASTALRLARRLRLPTRHWAAPWALGVSSMWTPALPVAGGRTPALSLTVAVTM